LIWGNRVGKATKRSADKQRVWRGEFSKEVQIFYGSIWWCRHANPRTGGLFNKSRQTRKMRKVS